MSNMETEICDLLNNEKYDEALTKISEQKKEYLSETICCKILTCKNKKLIKLSVETIEHIYDNYKIAKGDLLSTYIYLTLTNSVAKSELESNKFMSINIIYYYFIRYLCSRPNEQHTYIDVHETVKYIGKIKTSERIKVKAIVDSKNNDIFEQYFDETFVKSNKCVVMSSHIEKNGTKKMKNIMNKYGYLDLLLCVCSCCKSIKN